MTKTGWLHLHPEIGPGAKGKRLLAELVAALPQRSSERPDDEFEAEVERYRRRIQRQRSEWPKSTHSALAATVNVLADLSKHGWVFRVEGLDILGQPPAPTQTDQERDRRRTQLSARRNEQLREESTRRFILGMEQGRFTKSRRVSIFSLMRDGRELASRLMLARGSDTSAAIEPFVEVVERDKKCSETGLYLNDIWRYFRHTWANPYESVPGRSMMILVRDRAAPFRPVIGIAAISSAAVKLRARDEYLGWEGEPFLAACDREPSTRVAKWLMDTIDRSFREIHKTDLIRDGLLPGGTFRSVNNEALNALVRDSVASRERHHRQAESGEYKKTQADADAPDRYWREQAETALFRSKRAAELADLIALKAVLMAALGAKPTADGLKKLLAAAKGRQAIARIVRMARADTVGTAIADLTVCGAVPPYNALLGGKLVAMLAASPEIVTEYKARYSDKASIIASSMAGRRIVRPADLVFIGTTSLYGVRPSQYDRIAVPCDRLDGPVGETIRYDFIERTIGWGTFQFGKTTKTSIEDYVVAQKNGWRVNNVFGEGANPRMRALREGLAKLGLDEDELLHHGSPKSMYGVKLASNCREFLLGLDRHPNYLFSLDDPKTATRAIASFWASRWLKPRLERPEVLDQVGNHTLVHPVTHGARVQLPDADFDQSPLF